MSGLNKTIIITPRNSRILRDEKANDTSFIGTAVVGEEAASQYSERYYKYEPNNWNPMMLYRTPTDVINQALREASGDGADRYEIGHALGINCHIKSGNRTASQYIQELTKSFPNEIGQFHKMNGKIRSIRYFIKEGHATAFQELYNEFEKITGRSCPFKCGDVFKFPGAKLNTLRISDITLKRMNAVLKKLEEEKVVVTYFRLVKYLQDLELKEGYKYQMDKKSLIKIIVALERKGLLKITESVVNHGDTQISVKCVCHRSIVDKDHPAIPEAIANLIRIYEAESRLFPSGQLRNPASVKREAPEEEDPKKRAQRLATLERRRLKRLREKESDQTSETPKTARNKKPKISTTESSSVEMSSQSENEEEDEEEEMEDCEEASNDAVRPRRVVNLHKFIANQGKLMKLMMIHELIYYFLNEYKEGMIRYQDRFLRVTEIKVEVVDQPEIQLDPSSLASSHSRKIVQDTGSKEFKIPFENIPVVRDEKTIYRYLPPLGESSIIPKGWFAINEIMNILPLSVVAFISKYSFDDPIMMEFLRDPVKRFILYADLPPIFRHKIFPASKLCRVIEHKLMLLAAMGLVTLSKKDENQSGVEIETCHDLFYLGKVKTIKDTSIAPPSYMKISGDMNDYKSYTHKLDSVQNIRKYWHHVRAISLSTHFSFKRLLEEGDLDSNKTFVLGLIEKDSYRRPIQDYNDELVLNDANNGCCGFHPSLFLHLKRHWDINTGPDDIFRWFSVYVSESGEEMKSFIEQSVEKLNIGWNSCLHLLMAPDGSINKRNRKVQPKFADPTCRGLPILKRISSQSLSNSRKHKKVNGESVIDDKGYLIVKRSKTKKRTLDEKDALVIQDRTQLRVRFTKREKDLLVMIRAVGYFLKPIYRIWVSPPLIRDLMHNYVPESRTKTIQNILSAGSREMAKSQGRVEFFRYVNLFEGNSEMLDIKSKMVDTTKSRDSDTINDGIFLDAFNCAYRIIFDDDKEIPNPSVTDEEFFKYYKEKLDDTIDLTEIVKNSSDIHLPSRSLSDIQQELSFHVMLSSLLHSTTDVFTEESKRIEKLAFTLIESRLSEVIIKMKTESIICKPKGMDLMINNDSLVVSASMAILSTHFRYMFSVRYHNEIVSQNINDYKNIVETKDCTNTYTPGGLILICDLMESKGMHSCVTVGKGFIDIIDKEEELGGNSGLKRNKQLESANMKFDDIHLRYTNIPKFSFKLVNPENVAKEMIQKVNINDIKEISEEEFMNAASKIDGYVENNFRNLFKKLEECTFYGLTHDNVSDILKMSHDDTKKSLDVLVNKNYIFICGFDCRRYILIKYANNWVVKNSDNMCFMMRPWLNSMGDINISILKWMAECILLKLVDGPGISLNQLLINFGTVLRPHLVLEILEFLKSLNAITLEKKLVPTSYILDPFTKEKEMISRWEVEPVSNALTRFSQSFSDVEFHPLFTKECYQYS
uniref:B-block_TFIIIC domain-containing protein n=1 Tax=Parastrongyloides trichosuri TaxID=131310 RepID=A0A0N4Z4M9_PARTI